MGWSLLSGDNTVFLGGRPLNLNAFEDYFHTADLAIILDGIDARCLYCMP